MINLLDVLTSEKPLEWFIARVEGLGGILHTLILLLDR